MRQLQMFRNVRQANGDNDRYRQIVLQKSKIAQ
jgi:hypothetical protein